MPRQARELGPEPLRRADRRAHADYDRELPPATSVLHARGKTVPQPPHDHPDLRTMRRVVEVDLIENHRPRSVKPRRCLTWAPNAEKIIGPGIAQPAVQHLRGDHEEIGG